MCHITCNLQPSSLFCECHNLLLESVRDRTSNHFSRIELLHGQLRREKERIAALIVGRRQREAKLVGEFDSDEIYDPDDEGVLSMMEAQQESRRRIKALCVGRKLADCTTLLIDDLVRELQTFMTRCEFVNAPRRSFVSTLTPAAQNNVPCINNGRKVQ